MINKKFLTATPLFLAIMIDGMGLGIIFPILSSLMTDPAVSILPAATEPSLRNFYYGLVISIFMLAWFFGCAILGDLSDMIGRKKSLIICLAGSAVGFFLSAIAVVFHSYWLLVLGRLIDGFTAGSQPIAQAAVVDISGPDESTRYLGHILFAGSLGFILGPICGGYLSDKTLISWFSFALPFYFSGALSVVNVVLIAWFFHEKPVKNRQIKINVWHAIDLFTSAFKHPTIRMLSVILLTMMIGWSSYYTFISLFLLKKFQYTPTQISTYLALSAVGFGLGTSVLMNHLMKVLSYRAITILGLLIGAVGLYFTFSTKNQHVLWSMSVLASCGVAITYTALLSLFSDEASVDEQGWIMGITQSIAAFSFALTGILEAFVSNVSIAATMVFSMVMLLMSALITSRWQAPARIEKKQ